MNGKFFCLALGLALLATPSKAAVQATFISQTPSATVMTVPTDTTIVVSGIYKNTGTDNWSSTVGSSGYVVLCATNAAGTQLVTSPLAFNWLSGSNIVAPTSTVWSQGGSANAANSVRLKWTAVGDDSLLGRASRYDLRYSSIPLTAANWSSRSVWTGVPSPSMSGSPDSTMVTGLLPDQLYYYGIRAIDEANNMAAMSNSFSQKTATASYTFLFSLKTPSTPGSDTLYLSVYHPSTGTIVSTVGPRIVLNVRSAGPVGPDVEAFIGQLGGNSFADIMLYDRSAGQLSVALRDSTANKFLPQLIPWASLMPTGIGPHQVLLCDFTGDGLSDAIAWEWGVGKVYGARNLGTNSAFGPWRQMMTGYHPTSDTLQYTMLSEKFRTGSSAGLMLVDNYLGQNFVIGFTDTTCIQVNGPEPNGAFINDFGASPDPKTYTKVVGDINHDGLAGVLYYDWLAGDIYGLHNTGSSLQFIAGPNPMGAMLHDYAASVDRDYYQLVVGDFTGDGKLDPMFWAPDEARVYGTVGTGTSFTPTNGPGSFGSWLENFHAIDRDRYRILTGKEFPGSKDALIIEDRQTGQWSVAQTLTNAFQIVTGADTGGWWLGSWGPMGSMLVAEPTLDVPADSIRFTGLTSIAPNPCRSSAGLNYTISRPGHVSLRVYDVAGRLVETVVDQDRVPGVYKDIWRPQLSLAAGVYLVRLEAMHTANTKKVIVLR